MPWPQTGATQYQAQLGLTDKGGAIKGLIVCYVVWLGSMKGLGLVPSCGQDGYQAQAQQHSIEI